MAVHHLVRSFAATLAAVSAAAQDPAPSPTPEPSKLEVGGFVDGVFAYNFNKPADHANFFPGVGTSGKRDNELAVNLAQADLVLAPDPVGFKLSLGFGTGTEVVHAGEVRGIATSPDVWRNIIQASVLWQTKLGRMLGDVVATWKATPTLSLGASFDVAREGRPPGDDAQWMGVGFYARAAPPGSKTAFAVRGEYYDDEDGAISGIPQTLKEITATLQHRPVERLILKLEGRYDRSSALAFASDTLAVDGSPLRKREQFLLLLGVVAAF